MADGGPREHDHAVLVLHGVRHLDLRSLTLVALVACGSGGDGKPATTATLPSGTAPVADVTGVSITGSAGDYTFAVTIRSDETGCDQYADWWEVLTDSGDLVYRRILNHSHPDEQPFTRTGGPVVVEPGDLLWVRAHLHPEGYGGQIARGSQQIGFEIMQPEPGFASDLEKKSPLPADCWF